MRFMMSWIALLFASAAQAQMTNLNSLPEDFSFQSRGQDGLATVTYLGRDDDLFRFKRDTDDSLSQASIIYLWANQNSQTVRVTTPASEQRFTPHDCTPFLGDCEFTIFRSYGADHTARRSTFLIGDVWVDRLSILVNDEWVYYSKSCSTYDAFGFWIDFIYEEPNGTTQFGERISSSIEPVRTTSFKELRAICADAKEGNS